MVPTLTMLGRFSAATRGAAIPWFETTLVTLNSMAGQNPEVTSIPPPIFLTASYFVCSPLPECSQFGKNTV